MPQPVVQPLRRWDPERIGSYAIIGKLGAGAMGQVSGDLDLFYEDRYSLEIQDKNSGKDNEFIVHLKVPV